MHPQPGVVGQPVLASALDVLGHRRVRLEGFRRRSDRSDEVLVAEAPHLRPRAGDEDAAETPAQQRLRHAGLDQGHRGGLNSLCMFGERRLQDGIPPAYGQILDAAPGERHGVDAGDDLDVWSEHHVLVLGKDGWHTSVVDRADRVLLHERRPDALDFPERIDELGAVREGHDGVLGADGRRPAHRFVTRSRRPHRRHRRRRTRPRRSRTSYRRRHHSKAATGAARSCSACCWRMR